MEETQAVQPRTWIGFLVEFPRMPKLRSTGREECQRILFVCSAAEANPTELCFALFGRQIVMKRLQAGEVFGGGPARFAFVFAPALPAAPASLLRPFGDMDETVVILAQKENAVRSARFVTDCLAMPAPLPARPAAAGIVGEDPMGLDGDDAIWAESLPDIVMVDDEGVMIHAAADLNDYRAEYACRYVLAHFHENINRDMMADMVHLSPGYFSNLFRAEVGMSFSDYLIMVRIENAKAMLRRFELSVEAVSKKCGFNSLAHFSRTFKDRCGLSPLKYRKSPHLTT